MTKISVTIILFFSFSFSNAQSLLLSWSQLNIEHYTEEMYNEAQKLSANELLDKNLNIVYWSEFFLTLNASVNHHKNDVVYHQKLAHQITNETETKLKGTSRLIIWDRISSGDIVFEGKGLIIDNDIYKVSGRANQLLQNLTGKNFGFVNIHTTKTELKSLQKKWLDYLSGKEVIEWQKPEYKNAQIVELSSLKAAEALIVSLKDNPKKKLIIKQCLKNVYQLDEMPEDKNSSANYCNPDTYTYAYLNIIFGEQTIIDENKTHWWLNFWETNKEKLLWNDELGRYEVNESFINE